MLTLLKSWELNFGEASEDKNKKNYSAKNLRKIYVKVTWNLK